MLTEPVGAVNSNNILDRLEVNRSKFTKFFPTRENSEEIWEVVMQRDIDGSGTSRTTWHSLGHHDCRNHNNMFTAVTNSG